LIIDFLYRLRYLFIYSIVVTNSQSCFERSQYEGCSSNPACGCFQKTTMNTNGVCGYLWVTCSELNACERKTNNCYEPGHVCVDHPRCFSHPICYPLSKNQQQICPPILGKRTNKYSEISSVIIDTLGPPKPGDGICTTATWAQNGTIVAGGNDSGSELNQLALPSGIFVDDNQAVYVADFGNNRIVKWDRGASTGQLVAGGNGLGHNDNQLYDPDDVVVDRNGTMYISDFMNRRVQQWFRNAPSGRSILTNITATGVAQDERGSIYVADMENGELIKWSTGQTTGKLIAAGLPGVVRPCTDRYPSIYAAEIVKHQVLKIDLETKQIVRVAGGSPGHGLDQLLYPNSVIVDQLGNVYVADTDNHRIVRWAPGARSGSVIVGGRGGGSQLDQISSPIDLSFDLDGNLYVVDGNNRVLKFLIDRSSC
jgi:sugar lactone lactonase YvrE